MYTEKSNQLESAASILMDQLLSTEAATGLTLKYDPYLAPHVKVVEEFKTTNDHADFIKSELNVICPGRVSDFDKIFIEWKTIDPEVKYTSLLSLRSLIFYQTFDSLCEESKYSKAPWFKGGKKRFCQAKYFMLGNNDEKTLITTIGIQINSIANDMQKYFDNLSDYGKHGHDQATTDRLFSDVLAAFYQSLRIRRTYCV